MLKFLRKFTKRIAIIITLVLGISYLLGAYAGHFNPKAFWFASFFGFATFYFFIILILLFVFWLFSNAKYSLIPLTFILLGWGGLKNVLNINFNQKDFLIEKNEKSIRLMSWNVDGFKLNETKKDPGLKTKMINLINDYKPDIACFQEMIASDSIPNAINYLPIFAESFDMPYYKFTFNKKAQWDKNHQFGVITFSKFPIIRDSEDKMNDSKYSNYLQTIEIDKNGDTLQILNCHLKSFEFKKEERNYIENGLENETNSEVITKSKNIVSKIKETIYYHKDEIDLIANKYIQTDIPTLICGDFNDVPNSYTYETLNKNLQNAFIKKGKGISATFSKISPTLRIDNIWANDKIEFEQFKKINEKISDHYPIITDFMVLR